VKSRESRLLVQIKDRGLSIAPNLTAVPDQFRLEHEFPLMWLRDSQAGGKRSLSRRKVMHFCVQYVAQVFWVTRGVTTFVTNATGKTIRLNETTPMLREPIRFLFPMRGPF
jgi:hypothetical protein